MAQIIEITVTWIVFFTFIGGLYYWLRKRRNKSSSVDYSFGLKEAKNIKTLLDRQQYAEAENSIVTLSADNLTQVVDYITLSYKETKLSAWLSKSSKPSIPNLFLGVYYSHQAWLSRTNAHASEVTISGRQGFYEFQKKALEHLLSIDETCSYIAEGYSRLIRVYMGEGDALKVKEYFHKAIEIYPQMTWPYIHYCEAIEPKWGHSGISIPEFLESLPNNLLIRQIIELKLISDSFVANENYFGGTMKELNDQAYDALNRIDREITTTVPESVHRYIVYNYLMAIADTLEDQTLVKKYLLMMEGNYTLYPFGIMK